MFRKPRIEIGGGLYHLITRGNNRRRIFRSHEDYLRLIAILEHQKSRLPFYLYAYCLMPNHLHLLVERRHDSISRYEYSGHRAYVEMDASGLVDAEPVLRHFGGTKIVQQARFARGVRPDFVSI
jgi:REP element-mobilizing transposase RayT